MGLKMYEGFSGLGFEGFDRQMYLTQGFAMDIRSLTRMTTFLSRVSTSWLRALSSGVICVRRVVSVPDTVLGPSGRAWRLELKCWRFRIR